MIAAIEIAIAQSLGHMHRLRLLQPFQIHINALYFINSNAGSFHNNTVSSSLHQNLKAIHLNLVL